MQTTASSRLLRSAQILPINIGAQVFAADFSSGLPLDVDAERFAEKLPDRHPFSEVSDGRVATRRKRRLFVCRHAVEKCAKFFHAETLPHGKSQVNTFRLFTKWIEHLDEKTIQPARMIRVSPPGFHRADGTEFDFALIDSIPKDVLEGRKTEHYDVRTLPDIWIDTQESSLLH